jgi:aspartate/methionine/tyrosine aminotransferase
MTMASPAHARRRRLRVTSEIGLEPRRLAAPVAADVATLIRVLPVSATLEANEAMAARLRRGQPVLPLGFGEAGLPVHPALRAALAEAATCNSYGPVAGYPALRTAAAGYWKRRGLWTRPGSVICGPGSKALLFALMLAIGGDAAIPRPSWVSYAAHARLLGIRAHPVAVPAGEGGICDPAALDAAIDAAAAAGRPIRSTIVTLPDNPTGRVPAPGTVRAVCEVAEARGLIIISDEIYRDLIHDPAAPVLSPAEVAPQRTVVTTGLSKSLALGGWRIGVARMPDDPLGARLRRALLGAASEIWSAPAAPVQHAAALALSEPAEIRERISRSRTLHATVAGAVANVCADAGLLVPPPQGAFYVYPDFGPWRAYLQSRYGVSSSAGLARLLLQRYGAVTLPGAAFSDRAGTLTLRLATARIYGNSDGEQEAALAAADPLTHPPIAAALAQFKEILASLTT